MVLKKAFLREMVFRVTYLSGYPGYGGNYAFHGNAEEVFEKFFGTKNPFNGLIIVIIQFQTSLPFILSPNSNLGLSLVVFMECRSQLLLLGRKVTKYQACSRSTRFFRSEFNSRAVISWLLEENQGYQKGSLIILNKDLK